MPSRLRSISSYFCCRSSGLPCRIHGCAPSRQPLHVNDSSQITDAASPPSRPRVMAHLCQAAIVARKPPTQIHLLAACSIHLCRRRLRAAPRTHFTSSRCPHNRASSHSPLAPTWHRRAQAAMAATCPYPASAGSLLPLPLVACAGLPLAPPRHGAPALASATSPLPKGLPHLIGWRCSTALAGCPSG